MLQTSYAQLGQDAAVAEYFGFRRGGYFVEVGAFDGVALSNTCALERELGWRGLCVEPLPVEFASLRAARAAGTACINAAADEAGGRVIEFAVAGLFSGDPHRMTAHKAAVLGAQPVKIQVPTRTLTDMLDSVAAPRFIEYLSVDTEGSEVDVLRGVDWRQYHFGYITVEHNFQEPARSAIRALLAEKGYRLKRENQWDDDYVHV